MTAAEFPDARNQPENASGRGIGSPDEGPVGSWSARPEIKAAEDGCIGQERRPRVNTTQQAGDRGACVIGKSESPICLGHRIANLAVFLRLLASPCTCRASDGSTQGVSRKNARKVQDTKILPLTILLLSIKLLTIKRASEGVRTPTYRLRIDCTTTVLRWRRTDAIRECENAGFAMRFYREAASRTIFS